MSYNYPTMGEHYTPAYQLSALPFVTSSVISLGQVHRYDFPYVTRFIDVSNLGAGATDAIAIGFTENGILRTKNYVTLKSGKTINEEVRTTSLFVSCSVGTNVDYQLFCGITTIPARNFLVLTGSNGHPGVG